MKKVLIKFLSVVALAFTLGLLTISSIELINMGSVNDSSVVIQNAKLKSETKPPFIIEEDDPNPDGIVDFSIDYEEEVENE